MLELGMIIKITDTRLLSSYIVVGDLFKVVKCKYSHVCTGYDKHVELAPVETRNFFGVESFPQILDTWNYEIQSPYLRVKRLYLRMKKLIEKYCD